MLPGAAANATSLQTVIASADAYVSSADASTNFGSAGDLRVDSAPNTNRNARNARSYVRFDIPAMAEPIAHATLRIYATNGDNKGFAVNLVAGSWDEQTITWNNAPGYSASPTVASGPFGSGT